jgi:tetratricopeptide (TPR) repeat protein
MVLLLLGGDLDAAAQALKAGKPREAIELLGDLARDDDPRAQWILGRAHYDLKEYEAAVEPLLTASDKLPGDKEIALLAAYACWGSAKANEQYARAYLEDAIRMAERAKRDDVVALLKKDMGDYEGAIELFRKGADTLDVRVHIAECLAALGKEKEAQAAWGAVMDMALQTGKLQRAYTAAFPAKQERKLLAWLDARIKSEPEAAWPHTYRGYMYAAMGLHAKAIPDLRIGHKAQPGDITTAGRLCNSLIRVGIEERRDELLVEGEKLARTLIEQPRRRAAWDAYRLLAWWAWQNRDVPSAYRHLKLLIGKDPSDRDVALNFAAMARRLGHYDEARGTLETILQADEGDPAVINDLGIVFDGMGQRDKAVELWTRVLEGDPENMNSLENLLTAAWERGDMAAAKSLLERGLAVAEREGGGLLGRWQWFSDRLAWVPAGHGVAGGR